MIVFERDQLTVRVNFGTFVIQGRAVLVTRRILFTCDFIKLLQSEMDLLTNDILLCPVTEVIEEDMVEFL